MRIGHSVDIHKLVENRKLILGGVEIPFDKGLLGHSDADVLIHAVCEAIIGALALGDLGQHFPDNDEKYENISSMILLDEVYNLMICKGYVIGNLDATILLEKPILAPYKAQMRKNIADVLHTEITNVNIKATRGEGLGFVGLGLGIQAECVCLLDKVVK